VVKLSFRCKEILKFTFEIYNKEWKLGKYHLSVAYFFLIFCFRSECL
jgi:hypothetical protein